MNIFEKHEIFEMEVLEKLKNSLVLDSLVFGGGTMLRLCHDMKRYSVDLDFWRLKRIPEDALLERLKNVLERDYEITDSQIKRFSLLMEIRSAEFPKRLKIEVRREIRAWDFEEKIAYSRFSSKQVLLKAHTLGQSMKNKIEALLGRHEIRDAFDIEFLLRSGAGLPKLSVKRTKDLVRTLEGFTDSDFKVKLGSVLEPDMRAYYNRSKFSFLWQKMIAS